MALFGKNKEEKTNKLNKELEAFKERLDATNGRYISEMFVQGDMIGERFATEKLYTKIATVANQFDLKIINISRYNDQSVTVMFEITK